MGLEVAITARKRNFSPDVMQQLAMAYSRGTDLQSQGWDGSRGPAVPFLSDILQAGLERSMESELGVLLDSNAAKSMPKKRIRVQFYDNRVEK